jgi:hypothetical protein
MKQIHFIQQKEYMYVKGVQQQVTYMRVFIQQESYKKVFIHQITYRVLIQRESNRTGTQESVHTPDHLQRVFIQQESYKKVVILLNERRIILCYKQNSVMLVRHLFCLLLSDITIFFIR